MNRSPEVLLCNVGSDWLSLGGPRSSCPYYYYCREVGSSYDSLVGDRPHPQNQGHCQDCSTYGCMDDETRRISSQNQDNLRK
jgi:hypothetical protein